MRRKTGKRMTALFLVLLMAGALGVPAQAAVKEKYDGTGGKGYTLTISGSGAGVCDV